MEAQLLQKNVPRFGTTNATKEAHMAAKTTDTIQKIVGQATASVMAARSQAAEHTPVNGDRIKDMGTNLVETAREQLPHLQHRIAEQGKPAIQTLATQVHDLAAVGGERVRDASIKVNEDVLPSLRDVALNAASAAVELWEATRAKALEAAHEAQTEVAPVARYGITAGAEKAKETSHLVAHRVTDTAEQARHATRHAADATVTTSRDAGATLIWGAAAAGIVYYAFMDKERREQTLKTITSVIGGTRELIRDIRGYDAEF